MALSSASNSSSKQQFSDDDFVAIDEEEDDEDENMVVFKRSTMLAASSSDNTSAAATATDPSLLSLKNAEISLLNFEKYQLLAKISFLEEELTNLKNLSQRCSACSKDLREVRKEDVPMSASDPTDNSVNVVNINASASTNINNNNNNISDNNNMDDNNDITIYNDYININSNNDEDMKAEVSVKSQTVSRSASQSFIILSDSSKETDFCSIDVDFDKKFDKITQTDDKLPVKISKNKATQTRFEKHAKSLSKMRTDAHGNQENAGNIPVDGKKLPYKTRFNLSNAIGWPNAFREVGLNMICHLKQTMDPFNIGMSIDNDNNHLPYKDYDINSNATTSSATPAATMTACPYCRERLDNASMQRHIQSMCGVLEI
ncbi:hypothetical protein HELRODRAFT_190833 [Helobdella robusta]|uniref:Uncharacterized protein n=1 Tax=Helobdella robusta TaxID=6412 RepID=T1FSC3_HELRO|nr:hypothetical protein HELRODRAFT_190833 [Helobdella robusta]ESO07982.1 hypothetical protein HELRODRAFT_190833 [Helobdella robusta]